jgi:hypothetical protein
MAWNAEEVIYLLVKLEVQYRAKKCAWGAIYSPLSTLLDLELINAVRSAVTIPVIASSGAGSIFWHHRAEAGLASFHRKEIGDMKEYLKGKVEICPA